MWLCLACQMQKAPEPPPVQLQSHAKEFEPVRMDIPTSDASQKRPHPPADTVQKDKKPELAGKQDNKQTSKETEQPSQETKRKQQHTAEVTNSESQKIDPQQDKSVLFGFGFGGARSRSPSPQPSVSAVSGKVLGFGSSFLSSASNLISTAVQDESFTSPSSSRKASTASQISDKTPPTSRKGSAVSQMFSKMNTSPPSSRKGSEAAESSKNYLDNTDGTKNKVVEKGEEATKGATPQQQEQGEMEDEAVSVSSEVSRGRSQSPILPPAASAVSGKVLGFGSSFFSSASNLISSALDEPSTTPPTSRKGSTASQLSAKTTTPPSSRKSSSVSQTSDKNITSPSSRKGSEVSLTSLKTSKLTTSQKVSDASPKMHHSDDKKVNPENIEDHKTDEKSMVSLAQSTTVSVTKETAVTETTSTESTKSLPKACPLCTVDLQKEPPNYDTCTACKNTVCNLCGFNPMPHETEVSSHFYIEKHKKHLTVCTLLKLLFYWYLSSIWVFDIMSTSIYNLILP